jgi:hypothetical protein
MIFIFRRPALSAFLIAMLAALALAPRADALADVAADSEAEPSAAVPLVAFDADALKQGRFSYRITADGEVIGQAVIEVRATGGGQYSIVLDSKDIEQHWRSEFSRDFAPQRSSLEMSSADAPYSMQIEYSERGASGTQSRSGAVEPFSADILQQVVDQRVDWAAMMAATMQPTGHVEFQVFDPASGLSRLSGTRVETAPIDSVLGKVPAVRLDYTIFKGEHAEAYSVYSTREPPHLMLREEMPGGLVIELVSVEE